METFLDGKFYNPTKGNLGFHEVVKEIQGYMADKPAKLYEVIVGCDSSSSLEPTFPVVVVVLRKGEGGRFFLQRVKYAEERRFHNLHDRILHEVLLSVQFALTLREIFPQLQYIHADVGEHGPTKDMIREVTGLIRGNGFIPMIKPESFAASSVADRYS